MRRCESLGLALTRALAMTLAAHALDCAHAPTYLADGIAQGAPHPLVGRAAPSLSIDALDGGAASLFPARSADPHVTIVHFWATWSEASKQTLPKLEQVWKKHRASGLDVLAVSVDDVSADVPDFARTYGVKYPVAWDGGKSVVRHWLVREVPATFVVDARGVVRAAFLAYDDGFESEVESDVRVLTAERDADVARREAKQSRADVSK